MQRVEGFRRLSILFGILIWISFVFGVGPEVPPTPGDIALFLSMSVAVGFGGWGLIRFIGWVVEGFFGPSPH